MLPLGIFAWFGYKMPLETRLKLIADAGFTATCVWLGEEEEVVLDGHINRMPGLVRDQGLMLDNVHAVSKHCNLLWSESSIDRNIIQQEYEAALSFCHRHRIPILVIHITQSFNPPPMSTSGLEIIRSLVSQAEETGVIIAVENTTRPDYLEYVFLNIHSPNLGFCYDSSHGFVAREFRGEALEKWGSLLAATHFSDNKGMHYDHLLPGDGTINWESVVQQFPKRSYKGALMLEVDGPEAGKGLAAEEFLKLGYEKARQLAAKLTQ